MRVLMTTDTLGGVWVYSLGLARALAAHDVEVALAGMGAPPTELQKMEAGDIPGIRIFGSSYKLEWMEDPWEDIEKAGKWLLELEGFFHPDIVHLNNYAHVLLPWQAPTVVVGHSCVCSWWEAVHKSPFPAKWGRYKGLVKEALHRADYVTAPSNHMLELLKKHYGLNKENMRTIYNGRPADEFRPGTKHPFIFSAGRLWDEGKNISALDRAAEGISWPVYVAGPGMRPDLTYDEIGSCNGFKNVRKLGAMSSQSIAGWLGRSSIYCLPARYEPFGLSILEAALSGCALVLGDIPSLREIWEDSALFVPPGDPDALKDALLGLIANPAEMTKIAAFSRRRALELTPARMAREYMDIYSALIKKKECIHST
jgi:glycogen(starch) synthase